MTAQWLASTCVPDPAEGVYWHPEPGGRVLMPIAEVFRQAAVRQPQRSKVLRAAAISTARGRWGPGAREGGWQPVGSSFDGERQAVDRLCSHGFWDRLSAIGAGLHLSLLRAEAAVTADLVAQFKDGSYGILSVWPLHDEQELGAAWAELGAAVAALSAVGMTIKSTVVVCAGAEALKLISRPADDALGEWLTVVDLQKTMNRYELVK